MAIETNGRFTPNATKAALELFSATDMARTLTKLGCGLTRDQVALIASTYEQLFTPETVRRSAHGLVRERLMKKVQDIFVTARQAQVVAVACEHVYGEILDVKHGDWPGLYVRLSVALGMDPDAAECAHSVVKLRRDEGKNGEDARFASEQFTEMWSRSDRAALDGTRDFENALRDVVKTCIAAACKGALDGFKAADEQVRRDNSKARESRQTGRSFGRGRVTATA